MINWNLIKDSINRFLHLKSYQEFQKEHPPLFKKPDTSVCFLLRGNRLVISHRHASIINELLSGANKFCGIPNNDEIISPSWLALLR